MTTMKHRAYRIDDEGSVILGTREYERGSGDAAGNDRRIQASEGRLEWIR